MGIYGIQVPIHHSSQQVKLQQTKTKQQHGPSNEKIKTVTNSVKIIYLFYFVMCTVRLFMFVLMHMYSGNTCMSLDCIPTTYTKFAYKPFVEA